MSKKAFLSVLLTLLIVFGGLHLAENLQGKEWSTCAGASGDDWTMFHHDPAHTGTTTGSAPMKPVSLWNYTEGLYTSSTLSSSAVVVNGVVYAGSFRNPNEASGNIYAFDAYTGTKIWTYATDTYVQSASAVSENTLFIGVGSDVYALNALTGAKVWSSQTGGVVAPTIVNGIVYVGSLDGNLYALDSSTGLKIWNYTTGSGINSSPAFADGVVYVGSYDNNVYAINASTGTKVWNYTTYGSVTSSPAVSDGVVYVVSRDFRLAIGDENLYALNASTGNQVWKYTFNPSLTRGIATSPAVAYGAVYAGSEDGNVYAINASTGKKIWDFDTGYRVVSSPAVAEGVVYIGSGLGAVYALNASTGVTIWVFDTDNEVNASPAIADGILYVGSKDGAFYAIGEHMSNDYKLFSVLWVTATVILVAVVGIGLLVYFKKRRHQTSFAS